MGAIPVHHTGVDTRSAWDGAAEVAKLATPITPSVGKGMFAYYDSRGSDDNGDGWPDNKGSYKFPHHNVISGNPGDANLAAVRNALARMSQADIPQSNIEGVRAHLQAHMEDAQKVQGRNRTMDNQSMTAIGKLFSGLSDLFNLAPKTRAVSFEDIWMYVQDELDLEAGLSATDQPADMADGEVMKAPANYVLDVYTDGSETFALVTKSDGKLYKVPVTVGSDNSITTGDYQEVSMEFAPVTGRQVNIKRNAAGQVRWFAMPACTSVLNRSGEIDSKALFDSFIEYAERTGNYPELDFFHLGERLVLGKADWVARDGVGYCVSGLFYDTPVARAAVEALEKDPEFWGLSIAYTPTKEPEIIRSEEGVKIPVYNTGINNFVSLLPENTASSILTSINVNQEINRMNEKVKAALGKLLEGDPELLNQLVEKIDSVNRNAAGMIQREEVTTKETHVVETTAPAPVAQAQPAQAVAPAEARAISADDANALLNSPEFEAKVTEIVKKVYGMMNGAQQGGDQGQQMNSVVTTETPAQASQGQAQSSEEEIRTILAGIAEQIEALGESRTAAVTEVLNDLPARVAHRQIVRPRARATITPQRLQRGNVDMAAIAAQALETLPQRQQA